jgi:hypothetical protein
MKITFFLIAFALIFARVFFFRPDGNDKDSGTMTIKSDNLDVEMKWSGQVVLTDDGLAIASIRPGGYLKFKENDKKLTAKSNLQGEISYELYDGEQNLPLNDSGRRFLRGMLNDLVNLGFDAEGRVARLYKKGGKQALLATLAEPSKDHSDIVRGPCLKLLIKNDSLNLQDWAMVLGSIRGIDDDGQKRDFLNQFPKAALKDSGLARSWLGTVDSIPSDWPKKDLYKKMIDIGSGNEQVWISLIHSAAHLTDEGDKGELLVDIAKKMPATDSVKAVLLRAARTIPDDAEYGKVMRASQ